MTISRNLLCTLYALAGLVALVGTWGNNLQYSHLGMMEMNVRFWQETLANPASRSITVDILFVGLAAIIWMFLEARRLSMRGVWFWVLFGLFVAMGAAFPWFLVHRERVLAIRDGSTSAGTLSAGAIAAVAVLGLAIVVYTFFALIR